MRANSDYFLMCSQAKEEIQKHWHPSLGDCVFVTDEIYKKYEFVKYIGEEEADHMFMIGVGRKKPRDGVYFTFCPRQDQLQNMVEHIFKNSTAVSRSMLYSFSDFWKYVGTDSEGNPKSQFYLEKDTDDWSMEMLWLAFVMCKAYSKIWSFDTKDWVVIYK